MDQELIIYVILPILISILLIGYWLIRVYKKRKILTFAFALFMIIFNAMSIYILIKIWQGAYPSYTPHIIIILSLILIFPAKILINKK